MVETENGNGKRKRKRQDVTGNKLCHKQEAEVEQEVNRKLLDSPQNCTGHIWTMFLISCSCEYTPKLWPLTFLRQNSAHQVFLLPTSHEIISRNVASKSFQHRNDEAEGLGSQGSDCLKKHLLQTWMEWTCASYNAWKTRRYPQEQLYWAMRQWLGNEKHRTFLWPGKLGLSSNIFQHFLFISCFIFTSCLWLSFWPGELYNFEAIQQFPGTSCLLPVSFLFPVCAKVCFLSYPAFSISVSAFRFRFPFPPFTVALF